MRVLIISPHFPPTSAADMQRVRMVLPHMKMLGVECEVIAVEPAQVSAPEDPWLVEGLPPEVKIHRVKALGLLWSKIPSLGTLAFRALIAIRQKVVSILENGSFDLVYFSTTQFAIQSIGPSLKKRYGVPFIIDYQDPWVSEYYRDHPEVTPPGGKWKYAASSFLSRHLEPRTLQHCSGVTSVSASYVDQLEQRYSLGLNALVVPFPGDSEDFKRVKLQNISQTVFDPNDGVKHVVYVGRAGEDLSLAIRGYFSALQRVKPQNTKFHFIGTSYASAGEGVNTVEPIAVEYGLSGIVNELTARIPYSEALRCLLDADELVALGSDDPAYTASKIYPYLLADKPLLVLFHQKSSVCDLIEKVKGAGIISFSENDTADSIASKLMKEALLPDGSIPYIPLNHKAFEPYTAQEQTRKLKSFFETSLNR